MKKLRIILISSLVLASAFGAIAIAKTNPSVLGHKIEVPRSLGNMQCVGGEKNCDVLSTNEVALNNAMRKLWEEHVLWTRLYIVEKVADLPSASTTAARLLQNQVDIGNAIKPYYGETAGNQLTSILRTHILLAVDILNAAKANNTTALNQAKTDWYANAHDIAVFLHNLNPGQWSIAHLDAHMKEHLDLTFMEAVDQLHGNYSQSVSDFDQIETSILHLADTLTQGIIVQFPNKF